MENTSDGPRLHDKATRGELLSAEEQKQLDVWYAEQYAAETALLNQPEPGHDADMLRAEIARAVVQLQEAAQRVHDLATENEALRSEVTALQRQLAQRLSSRVA